MFIEKITICNLFAYYGAISVEFKKSDSRNLYCIYGNNGFGKTSFIRCTKLLFLGLESDVVKRFYKKDVSSRHLLYGNHEWSGIVNKYALDDGRDEYFVSFEGRIDGEAFILKRSFEGVLTKELGEILELKIGDRVYENEMAHEKLSNILPDSFIEFFFFDGEELEKISDDLHTGLKAKMEAILQIAPVDMLINQIGATKKELITQQESNAKNQAKLIELEAQCEYSTKIIENLKNTIQQLESTQKNKQAEKESAQKELSILVVNSENDKKNLQSQKDNEEVNLKREKESFKEEILHIVPLANTEILQEIKEYEESLKDFTSSRDLEGYDECVQKINDNILNDIIKQIAPKLDNVDTYKRFIHMVLKEIPNRLKSQIKQSDIPAEAFGSIAQGLMRNEMSKLQKGLDSICTIKQDIVYFEEELKEFQVDEGLAFKKEQIDQTIKELESDIATRSLEIDSKKEELIRQRGALENATKEKDALYAKINTERIQKQLALLDRLDGVFRQYKEWLIATLKDRLRDEILCCYKKLVPNDNLFALEINSDFKITMRDENNDIINVANQSSGQRQILAISIFWALSILSESKIPLIIDTPLARIDGDNRHNLISHYYNQNNQVIILPHNGEMGVKEYEIAKPYIAGLYKINNQSDRGHASIKIVYDALEVL